MASKLLDPLPAHETILDSYKSVTFAIQMVMTMAINFGINFGLEWAFMSQWGAVKDTAGWPGIPALRLEAPLNSCLALDFALTPFFIGFLCTLAATDGTQKEVLKGACAMLEPAALSRGWWKWTPVPIRSLLLRALATGLFAVAFLGAPTFLIAWAAIGTGRMNGYSYTCFKGAWGMLVSGCVYAFVFPAAICKHNFPELEFEELAGLAGDAPPLVANPESVAW
jgi:hypothetical protein